MQQKHGSLAGDASTLSASTAVLPRPGGGDAVLCAHCPCAVICATVLKCTHALRALPDLLQMDPSLDRPNTCSCCLFWGAPYKEDAKALLTACTPRHSVCNLAPLCVHLGTTLCAPRHHSVCTLAPPWHHSVCTPWRQLCKHETWHSSRHHPV